MKTIPLEQAKIEKVMRAVTLAEFLAEDIPPHENLLAPIIQTQSLSMMFAKRGVGKTNIALGIAHAIAGGGEFLQWSAPKPKKVLYLDGEMPARLMQERLKAMASIDDEDNFKLLTPDLQPRGMPDLSTSEGQQQYWSFIEDRDFIVVDNLSTLVRSGKENEAESWQPIQDWALEMRSLGKSVMFIHHAGKGGGQRGTSRREDILDLVMVLKHPDDYSAEQGARFEVHFEKARQLIGQDVKPFEAKFNDGEWDVKSLEDVRTNIVLKLKQEGMSLREIQDETGVPKSTVQRILKAHEPYLEKGCPTVPLPSDGTMGQ